MKKNLLQLFLLTLKKHMILLITVFYLKVAFYGIRIVVLDWFRNYLYSRKQCVKIGSEFSEF